MKKILSILTIAIVFSVAIPHAQAVIRDPATKDDVASLQAQVDQINALNAQLQARVSALENKPAASVAAAAPQVDQTARIEALETRVSVLEKIVNTIKESVMSTLQTTIGLLKQLLTK